MEFSGTHRNLRSLTVFLTGAAMVAASAVATTPATAAPARGPSAIPSCTKVQAAQRRFIGANGKAMAQPAGASALATAATELTYRMPDGTTAKTIAPPAGFQPQNAAPATARAYGFDAPDDPVALKAWRARYKDYKTTVPSAPCVGRAPISHRFAAASTNWGGYVATGGPYNEVDDSQNIPTYTNVCEPEVTASWIGIGGYTSGRLIQQGLASNGPSSTGKGVDLWYEYLNESNQNPPVYIGPDSRTGDVIAQYITYSAGTAVFHWYDSTAGIGWSPVTVSGIADYYDATSADFITERPAGFYLPKFSRVTFSAARARYNTTSANLFNFTNTEVQLDDSAANLMIRDTKASASSFYQDWQRCS